MGRKRIQIKYIEDLKARRVCFSKRRDGLFRKASDFGRDIDLDVALVVFSETGKVYEYGNTNHLLRRFLDGADHDGGSNSCAVVDDVPVSANLEVKEFLNVDASKLSDADLDIYRQYLNRMTSQLLTRVTDIKSSSSWPTNTGGLSFPLTAMNTEDSSYLATTYTDYSPLPATTIDHTTEGSSFPFNVIDHTEDSYFLTAATNAEDSYYPMTNDTELDSYFLSTMDFDQAPPPVDTLLLPNTFPTEPVVRDQMSKSEDHMPTLDEFCQTKFLSQMMNFTPSFCSTSTMDTNNTPTFNDNNLWASGIWL